MAILLSVFALAGVIYLLSRVNALERTVERLHRQLWELTEATKSETAKPVPRDTQAEPATAAPPPVQAIVPPRPPAQAPVSPPPAPAVQSQPRPSQPNAIDKLFNLIKRYFTEGNLIVRVGIVVLFFGVGFLFKYANAQGAVPAEFNLACCALLGLILLTIGWRLRLTRGGYALAMQGGGIGILYITLFVALRLFHLMPAGAVFVLLLVMVTLSAALAVLQDARSLAVLAISGGFLAPVLTSTGGGSHIGLFSFYAALNIGIVAIAWFKSWRMLNVLGFLFTFVIGTAWGVARYRADLFVSTEIFLIIFFLFYVAIALLFARQQPPRLKGYVDGTIVFGVPLVAFALQAGLVQRFDYGLAWSSFALGAFYIAIATISWRRGGPAYRLLSEAFLALGVVFASLTVPFALEGEWIATAWALEGAAIVWISVRQQRRLGTAFAILLQLGAGFGFLIDSGHHGSEWPVLNSMFIGALLVALAALFSSYYLTRHYAGQKRWETVAAILLLLWGLCWWFGNGIAEIEAYVSDSYVLTSVQIFVALSAAALGGLEWKLRWAALRYTVIGLTATMVVFALIAIILLRHPLAEHCYIGWPLLLMAFYALLYQRDRAIAADSAATLAALPYLHATGWWLLALLLSDELRWLLRQHANLSGGWLVACDVIIVLIMMLKAIRVNVWPYAPHRRSYLTWALTPLAVYTMLWSLFGSAASAGAMQPLPYLPLLNPLDIVQVSALLTLILWWRALQQHQAMPLPDKACWSVFAGLLFVWLNAVLLRSLHHWAGVGYDMHTFAHSSLVQAALAIFWTVIGLAVMVISAHRRWRPVWIAGAVLLGIVILKLIVQAKHRDTLEVIVSFIVVGILLLVVGYFSPLPPKSEAKDSHNEAAAK